MIEKGRKIIFVKMELIQMKRIIAVIILGTLIAFSMTGCSKKFTRNDGINSEMNNGESVENNEQTGTEDEGTGNSEKGLENPDDKDDNADDIDIYTIKPNEAGKVMVVMFHRFVESFTPSSSDDGQFVTTFDNFRALLQKLYDKNYRLISLNDYLTNNIDVPAGCIPMVFTFDDGTSGQFNLIEKDGELVVNPKSAVGIMEEFYKTHPDFGLEGTFYVNLGADTFAGSGTLEQRLNYLIEKGFEIGNHTMTHINLSTAKSVDEIKKEVGGNQKILNSIIEGYTMNSLALPYGSHAPKGMEDSVISGTYEGVEYKNLAVLEVGAGPTVSPVSKNSKPTSMSRVRATGMINVDCDLDWWLERLTRDQQYISDGNPNKVTIPKSEENNIDMEKLQGKQLVIY